MKAKFIKGTTLHGKPVNGGDVLELDDQLYRLFVHINKDAVPYEEPVKAKAVEPVAVEVAKVPSDEKKGKK
jgi:hypothetical protein